MTEVYEIIYSMAKVRNNVLYNTGNGGPSMKASHNTSKIKGDSPMAFY